MILIRNLSAAIIGTFVLCFMVASWHWPLVGDVSLMHYICFLIDHKHMPYRDIVDMNLPGSYLIDWGVIHLMGPGALACRLFDFLLLGAMTAAMVAIARPYNWLSAVFASGLLVLIHGRDGIDQAGERDLILAVFLLIAFACLLAALRGNEWLWSIPFGVCVGMATLIKPPAAVWGVGVVLLAFAWKQKERERVKFILAGLSAFSAPMIAVLIWLQHDSALRAFWDTLTGLDVDHAHIGHLSYAALTRQLVPSFLLPWIILWLPIAATQKSWRTREGRLLLFSIAFGIASFYLQGKGFPYHRYPMEVFLLLLISMECVAAFSQKGLYRPLAAAALGYSLFVIAPVSLVKASHYDWRDTDFITLLSGDLRQLGGNRLSGQVQCLDTTAGCVNTLYDLQIMQTTGFLYDCYFFSQPEDKVTKQLRNEFLGEMRASLPKVIVVSDQFCFRGPNDYSKLNRWVDFQNWLKTNYTLYADRMPARPVRWWSRQRDPLGYRIYLRNNVTPFRTQ